MEGNCNKIRTLAHTLQWGGFDDRFPQRGHRCRISAENCGCVANVVDWLTYETHSVESHRWQTVASAIVAHCDGRTTEKEVEFAVYGENFQR